MSGDTPVAPEPVGFMGEKPTILGEGIHAGSTRLNPNHTDPGDEWEQRYLERLKATCAASLDGLKCKDKTCTQLHACWDFRSPGRTCPVTGHPGLIHDDMVHIRVTCRFIYSGKDTCPRENCPFGHDYPEVRRAIYMAMRARAALNESIEEARHVDALRRGSKGARRKEARRNRKQLYRSSNP